MTATLNVAWKEVKQLSRDPIRLRLTLIMPIIQLILLGYAANLDVRLVPLAVLDGDRTRESREITERFTSSGYFILEQQAGSPSEVDEALDQGGVSMALVIPPGFAADLKAGRTADLQVIADGSDGTFATRGLGYAAQIVQAYSADILVKRGARVGGIATVVPVPRVWFNPELESRWFLVPGILVLVLLVVTLIGTAMNVVREYEIGTMEQLSVTPIKPYQLLIGKLIPNAVVGMVEIAIVLVIVRILFHLPIRGSLTLLFAVSVLFLISMQGLGLFISTISKTQQQSMMSAMFFVMLPMILLSGFVFPIQNMPEPVQLVTYLIPLRFFFDVLRGILLKGVGLEVLWDEALILGGYAVAVMGLAVVRFHKRAG